MADLEPRPPAPDWYTRLPLASLFRAAAAHQVDPYLLAGICQHESSGDIWAMRFEPTLEGEVIKAAYYPQAAMNNGITTCTEKVLEQSSFGLCQLLGLTARRLGYAKNLARLFDPMIGLDYGAMLLAQLLKRYGAEVSAIAAYNAGEPKMTPAGTFVNQAYVDSVCKWVKQVRGS